MALFGVPIAVPDHATRAIRCAIAMQRRQGVPNEEGWPGGLSRLEIGINSGRVVAGTLGGVGRRDNRVIGDAVNVAERLQSVAGGGEILVSDETLKRAPWPNAEPVGAGALKGRREPVETYRIPIASQVAELSR